MPFALRAIQVDGGAEFHAAFEAECARRGLRLFVCQCRTNLSSFCRLQDVPGLTKSFLLMPIH
jgi:hypothetical protein